PESLGVMKAPSGAHSIRYRESGLSFGWRKRIAKELNITSATKLENLVRKHGGYSGFKKFLDSQVKDMSVNIDPQCTTDIHRIFRMPGTLNSKSSLAKVQVKNLADFDPFVDACAIGDELATITAKVRLKLKMKGKTHSLSMDEQQVPAYVACYSICKG